VTWRSTDLFSHPMHGAQPAESVGTLSKGRSVPFIVLSNESAVSHLDKYVVKVLS
jgi:hypothetical protein